MEGDPGDVPGSTPLVLRSVSSLGQVTVPGASDVDVDASAASSVHGNVVASGGWVTEMAAYRELENEAGAFPSQGSAMEALPVLGNAAAHA